jgi:hypothetical protein
MDWFFLELVIFGSVLGWAKESERVLGQHAVQEVTKEKVGRLMITGGWSGLLLYAANVYEKPGVGIPSVVFLIILYSFFYFGAMGVEFNDKNTVIRNYKNQRLFSQNYDCISYKVVHNMYLMHPELFKWDYNSIYPAFKGLEFRMTYFDLLLFSLLYDSPKIKKNGVVSQMMLEQLDKDMARIQKEKEKSIQEINHASTELADIMASMKGEMK